MRGYGEVSRRYLGERPNRQELVDRLVVHVETPAEFIAIRAKIGMDYGRLDYVLVDGMPVIYDVNRTPASSPGAVERFAPQWREMARGIEGFLV